MASLQILNGFGRDIILPKKEKITGDALKLHAPSSHDKEFVYLGNVNEKTFDHAECIITGNKYNCRSAYKSHRKGYVFSDAAKDLATRIRSECNHPNKVCVASFPIKSPIKKYFVEDFVDNGQQVPCKFSVRYDQFVRSHQEISRNHLVCKNSLAEAKEFVSDIVAKGDCMRAEINEVHKTHSVHIGTKELPAQALKYFTYN